MPMKPQHVTDSMPCFVLPVMSWTCKEEVDLAPCEREQFTLLGINNGTIWCNICLPLGG